MYPCRPLSTALSFKNALDFKKLIAAALLAATTGLIGPQTALAASIDGPLTLSEFQDLTDGADYGPPPPIRGHDENTAGPLVFNSGDQVTLFGAAGVEDVASILLVISASNTDVATLGSISIDFSMPDLAVINLGSTDFFTTDDLGFPNGPPGPGVTGLGNGDSVNGIAFPGALHGGVLVELDDLSDVEVDDVVAMLTVTTGINLRVDIFGVDANGVILNNASNSGAFGVRPGDYPPPSNDIPEPATIAMLTIGLAGMIARKTWKHV